MTITHLFCNKWQAVMDNDALFFILQISRHGEPQLLAAGTLCGDMD